MKDDRDLLFTDICARLKYNVKVRYKCFHVHSIQGLTSNGLIVLRDETDKPITTDIKNIQPYLFPLSSMTKEQKEELENLGWHFDNFEIHNVNECLGTYKEYVAHLDCFVLIDWLNKNHFDYRGLIEKGLAVEINKSNNPYKK